MTREHALRAKLAHALRQARRVRGLTQRTLAARAGIGEKYLSRIERGLVTPSLLVALELTAALGVPLTELLERPSLEGPPAPVSILKLLADRSASELERAERVLRALFA
ncbi:MAG TPA: helix-turn-helix transcriptional regulator [Polyangiaceae bacterium]|nr:helix-turn-helix transcriptional regulator [Polyangiaceae bacterium]